MKTIRNLAAVLLSASLLTVSVSAAIEFTPSVEEKTAEFAYTETDGQGRPVVGYTRDAEGRLTESISSDAMVITPLSKANTAAQVVRDNLSRAEKALRETAIETLIPTFAEAWQKASDGAPVANATVAHIFDVTLEGTIAHGHTLTFTIKNPGIAQDTAMMVLHNYTGDRWEIVPHTRNEDGDITITASSLSPFAIVVDNGNAPVVDDGAPQSPGTGVEETANMQYLLVILVIAVAGLGAILAVRLSKRAAK